MMKLRLFSIVVAALLPVKVFSQAALRQGLLKYDLAIDVRKQMAKQNRAMALMVPKQIHMNVLLSFSDDRYAVTMSGNFSVMGVSMPMPGVDERQLVDLKAGSQRTERAYSGRIYYTEVISKPRPVINYGSQTKVILGYTCNFATVVTPDKTRYNVWYTPAIPRAYSPDGLDFAGLKGAVLECSNDEQVLTAVGITSSGFAEASIIADANAKKITEEQMNDLREEAAEDAMKKALAARKKKK